jgi:aminoglycoside 3-N-acetyltransferase
MKYSYYTIVGAFVKKILGVKDFSLFKKNIHKNLGKTLYHKKYTSEDLISKMCEMGMKQGSLVCIHASMKEFYNYVGSVDEIILGILEVIGPDGTLMMPAYPKYNLLTPEYIFDINKDPTGAGLLAETFRKFPDVKRSINVTHSVCAIGPLADYLLKDHHKGEDCWDKNSPWYRLCEKNGLVFNLGMPRSFMGTFMHCVESLLKKEHPYWSQFFTKKVCYKYYDENHQVKTYINYTSEIERRSRKKKLLRRFNSDDWAVTKLSNLEIKVFYTRSCLSKMVSLGRKGITVYWRPSPSKFTFNE